MGRLRALMQRRIRAAMARAALRVMAVLLCGLAVAFGVAGALVWASQRIGVIPALLAAAGVSAALALLLWAVSARNDQREKRIAQAILDQSRADAELGCGRDTVLLVVALLLRHALHQAKPSAPAGRKHQA